MTMHIVATGTALAVAAGLLRKQLPPELPTVGSGYKTREWVSVATPLGLMDGMNVLLARTDVLMVGLLLGTDAAGIYHLAASFGPAGVLLTMTGRHRLAVRSQVAALLVNVVGNGLLIPWWGLVGAACATVASPAVLRWSMHRCARHSVGISSTIFHIPRRSPT